MPNYPMTDFLAHVRQVREAAYRAGTEFVPCLSIGDLEVRHRDPEALVLALADVAVRMALPPLSLVADGVVQSASGVVSATVVIQAVDADVVSVTAAPFVAVDELGLMWTEPFRLPVLTAGRYWPVVRLAATVGAKRTWEERRAASIFCKAGSTVARPGLIGGAR